MTDDMQRDYPQLRTVFDEARQRLLRAWEMAVRLNPDREDLEQEIAGTQSAMRQILDERLRSLKLEAAEA